jgi:pseudouridine kinase
MLTDREQQILNWIRINPSITQKEIAERAHISRSSVAVHISNLTKKGAILGRRYVLADKPYIAVVGGTNMDLAGHPAYAPRAHDTMPGTVTVSAGGTARNIAHNLALLGCNVKLITVFGDDIRATELVNDCRKLNIDIDNSITIPGGITSTHLFIMDEQGDMTLAISDMKILDQLTPEALESRLGVINHAQVCVVDTNISIECLAYLADHVRVPLYCDTVSTSKALKVKGLIGKLDTIKPNQLEVETLTGVHITDDRSMKLATKKLLDQGVKRVVISLGARGAYAADRNNVVRIPSFASNIVSTTGAGDTMMAAITWAQTRGESLANTCAAGVAAAAICTESYSTVNPALSADNVLSRMAAAGYDSQQ